MIYLSERSFLVMFFVAFLGYLSTVWSIFGQISVATGVFWGLVFFLDWKTLSSMGDIGLTVSKIRNPRLNQKINLDISAQLQRGPMVSGQVQIEILAPDSELVAFQELKLKLSLKNTETEKKCFTLIVRKLGFGAISHLRMNVFSTLGFFKRQGDISLKEPLEFRVTPELNLLSETSFQDIIKNQPMLTLGKRQKILTRSPDIFYSIRKYIPSDSIGHLDHKKSAKYNYPMTRVYESTFNHHVILGMDLGRGMVGTLKDSSKHDYYISAALQVAATAFRLKDKVSFFAFSSEVHSKIRFVKNMNELAFLYRGNNLISPRNTETNFHLVPEVIQSLTGQRAIIILFCDLTRPSALQMLQESIGGLCQKHLVIVLGVISSDAKLENQINSFQPLSPQTSFEKEAETLSRILFEYWANDSFSSFSAQVSRMGGASLLVTDDLWLTVNEKIYALLRRSIRL